MEEIDVGNWGTFQNELARLRKELASQPSPLHSDPLLFRGQGNSEWRLQSTLERAGMGNMRFSAYYELISRIRPAVEAFTETKWDLPNYHPEKHQFAEYDAFNHFPAPEVYAYMVYLRHHGFPSPLLDWSFSPAVAAFFAFREPQVGVKQRSIYMYCETVTGLKGFSSAEPRIHRIGPYVRSHRRHFRQQCDYTICGSFEKFWRFTEYETVLASAGKQRAYRQSQDVLWKFNFDSNERMNVLRMLEEYNLNAFSLFDSQEALMETTWVREMISLDAKSRKPKLEEEMPANPIAEAVPSAPEIPPEN